LKPTPPLAGLGFGRAGNASVLKKFRVQEKYFLAKSI
jgi:hypothetical protein